MPDTYLMHANIVLATLKLLAHVATCQVAKGEPILVVESDKADMDVESFAEGILGAIVVGEGERANVGSVIAFVAESEAEVAEAKRKAGGLGGGVPAAAPAGECCDQDVVLAVGYEHEVFSIAACVKRASLIRAGSLQLGCCGCGCESETKGAEARDKAGAGGSSAPAPASIGETCLEVVYVLSCVVDSARCEGTIPICDPAVPSLASPCTLLMTHAQHAFP